MPIHVYAIPKSRYAPPKDSSGLFAAKPGHLGHEHLWLYRGRPLTEQEFNTEIDRILKNGVKNATLHFHAEPAKLPEPSPVVPDPAQAKLIAELTAKNKALTAELAAAHTPKPEPEPANIEDLDFDDAGVPAAPEFPASSPRPEPPQRRRRRI